MVGEEVEEDGEEEIPVDVILDVPPNSDSGPEVTDQKPEQEIQMHHVSTHNVCWITILLLFSVLRASIIIVWEMSIYILNR